VFHADPDRDLQTCAAVPKVQVKPAVDLNQFHVDGLGPSILIRLVNS